MKNNISNDESSDKTAKNTGSGGTGGGSDNDQSIAHRKNYRNYGLDLNKGRVVDQIKAGVLEPAMSKNKQLKSAVEACIAIMRIDTMIKLDPEQRGGEDDGHGH